MLAGLRFGSGVLDILLGEEAGQAEANAASDDMVVRVLPTRQRSHAARKGRLWAPPLLRPGEVASLANHDVEGKEASTGTLGMHGLDFLLQRLRLC